MSTITSKTLLPLYSSNGDTVCMTLFVVPILAHRLPFWPSSLTHLWVPCLPTEQTLTVSHLFRQKARSIPSGLMSPISQPVSPLSSPKCPSVHDPLWTLKWQETMEGGERVWDKNWSLFGGADRQLVTQDVLMSIFREMDLGRTEWWELYNTKEQTNFSLGPSVMIHGCFQSGTHGSHSWVIPMLTWVFVPQHSASEILSIHFFAVLCWSLWGSHFFLKIDTLVQYFQGTGATAFYFNLI